MIKDELLNPFFCQDDEEDMDDEEETEDDEEM